jgi:zinc protease
MQRTSVSLALLLLVAAAPVAASAQSASASGGALPAGDAPAPLAASEPVRFQLANGLRVWIQPDRRRPIAHVRTVYKVGSLNEGPGLTGLAHYVEHMVYRATENIANEDIYGIIDRIGGRWTGGTSSTATSYGETVPAWALDDALRITAERMARAVFDDVEFERERQNVVTEANGFARTDPVSVLRDAVRAAAFEIHPYRYSSNTWYLDNLAVTRGEAYDFYRQHYGPNNAVLAIVGDVDVAEARRLVERHFGALPPAARSGEVRIVEPPQQVEKRLTLAHPGAEPRVEIAFRAPQATHPDYPVLVVFDRVIAGRMAAWGTAAVTTSHEARPYPYLYRFVASPPAAEAGEHLIERIQNEIDRIARDGIAADELARATSPPADRASLPRPDPAAPLTTAAHLARIAMELTGREVFPWELPADIGTSIRAAETAVTVGDLQAYARNWLARSQRTVGVLVPGDTEPIVRWTDLRPVHEGRMAIPPLTVPPAARRRPLPVPSQARAPLAALPIAPVRRELSNGVVLRAVDAADTLAALSLRLAVPMAATSAHDAVATLLAARALGAALEEQIGSSTADVRSIETLATDAHVDLRLSVARSALDLAIDRVAHALAEPGSVARELDAQRAALQRELNDAAGTSDADAVARRFVLQRVAPHWSHEPRSAADALAALHTRDASEFLMEQLGGGTLVIAIAASDATAMLGNAASAFGGLKPRRAQAAAGPGTAPPPSSPAPAPDSPFHAVEAGNLSLIPLAGETQASIAAALPGAARDDADFWPLQMLNYIVGMPFYGGRLGWALTKGGLTYSSAAETRFGATAGHVLFATRSNPANLEASLQAMQEVIGQVGQEGVSEWELHEAQGFTLGRLLLNGTRDDSDAGALATALLDSESSGREWLDLPALSAAILAVTRADLERVAARYYRLDQLHIAAAGQVPPSLRASPFPAGTFRALFE